MLHNNNQQKLVLQDSLTLDLGVAVALLAECRSSLFSFHRPGHKHQV